MRISDWSSDVCSSDLGGDPLLRARMRAHANYAEYTPFFLILLGLIELARGTHLWLWGVAILYVIGRILHAFGMDSLNKRSEERRVGKEGVSTFKSRWSPYLSKTNQLTINTLRL